MASAYVTLFSIGWRLVAPTVLVCPRGFTWQLRMSGGLGDFFDLLRGDLVAAVWKQATDKPYSLGVADGVASYIVRTSRELLT